MSTSSKASLTATPGTVREINRAIILNLVRLHEPVSRKNLSELSGMFPSNISAVVDELLRDGLLIEQRTKPLGPGRTPVHLFLNPGALRVLGINLRAEKTTVAWAGLSGRMGESKTFGTSENPEQWLRELTKAVEGLRRQSPELGDIPFHSIGVSVPGLVDPASGSVLMAPALPKLCGFPLGNRVSKNLGGRTFLENDSNVTMLAEQWFGKRELADLESALLLSISDFGVGSGLTINSRLYRGHNHAWAGEFGHMVVNPSGPRCRCGRRGCWERFVCNEATLKRYDADASYTPEAFEALIDRALNGDPKAVRCFEETAEYLSLGLSNITFTLNPRIILIAGAITRIWHLVQRVIEASWRSPGISSKIELSRWSLDELHLRGSIALALQEQFAAPRFGLHVRPESGAGAAGD